MVHDFGRRSAPDLFVLPRTSPVGPFRQTFPAGQGRNPQFATVFPVLLSRGFDRVPLMSEEQRAEKFLEIFNKGKHGRVAIY